MCLNMEGHPSISSQKRDGQCDHCFLMRFSQPHMTVDYGFLPFLLLASFFCTHCPCSWDIAAPLFLDNLYVSPQERNAISQCACQHAWSSSPDLWVSWVGGEGKCDNQFTSAWSLSVEQGVRTRWGPVGCWPIAYIVSVMKLHSRSHLTDFWTISSDLCPPCTWKLLSISLKHLSRWVTYRSWWHALAAQCVLALSSGMWCSLGCPRFIVVDKWRRNIIAKQVDDSPVVWFLIAIFPVNNCVG